MNHLKMVSDGFRKHGFISRTILNDVRQRENQKVADYHSQGEHGIATSDHPHDVFSFIGIQSRRYEPEQLV